MLATASERALSQGAPIDGGVAPGFEWNCELYLKFESERTRAAKDLLAQIQHVDAKAIVDLGCGPGNSTELLAAAFPEAKIIGVDYSENMLAAARERAPTAQFLKADIENWVPGGDTDIVFANSSLHFTQDHRALLLRLVAGLRSNAQLAVQMPDNTHELSHAAMRMVAADGPWASRLLPIAKTRAVIGAVDEYYALLRPLCRALDIWETSYVHPLDGPDDIVQWFAGSGLRPFLELLSEDERAVFLARYRDKLEAYPREPDGAVLLRYPRLFVVLRK